MNLDGVIECLERLARGVDPVTGVELSGDSPLHHPVVIRSLFAAIRMLEQADDVRDGSKRCGSHPRAGQPWDSEEVRRLLDEFHRGMPFKEIAISHQRSRGAIVSRLDQLGCLTGRQSKSREANVSVAASNVKPDKWWRTERPQAGKPWTQDEDDELKRLFGLGLSYVEIASRLDRGEFAVEVRLFKLGLPV